MDRYLKLVLRADPDRTRGFVVGWCAGKGYDRAERAHRVVWPEDWNIRVGSTLQGIVEAIRPGDVSFVIVREDTVPDLVAAFDATHDEVALALRSQHRIEGAHFEFKFEIFNRDEAKDVRRVFESLPEGAALSKDYSPEERSDPDATGAELYAPVHPYTCRAKGTVAGELRAVLEVYQRARQYPRVELDKIVLELTASESR